MKPRPAAPSPWLGLAPRGSVGTTGMGILRPVPSSQEKDAP
jgi:hypothetical protein